MRVLILTDDSKCFFCGEKYRKTKQFFIEHFADTDTSITESAMAKHSEYYRSDA